MDALPLEATQTEAIEMNTMLQSATQTRVPYGILYLITDKRTDDAVYVGQASQGKGYRITLENGEWVASDRIGEHERAARKGGKRAIDIHMHEQEFENFLIVTLPGTYASKKQLNRAEKRKIKDYNTFHGDNPNAFNMTRGGQSGKDFVSPATCQKISDSMKEYRAKETPAQEEQRRERVSAARANESPAQKEKRTLKYQETRHKKNPDKATCVTPECYGRPRKQRKHFAGRCLKCFEKAWMENPSIGPSYLKCKEEGCRKPGYTAGLCGKHYQAKNRARRNANEPPVTKVEIIRAGLETRQRNNPNRATCVTPECLGMPQKRRKHFEGRCLRCFEKAWLEDPSIGPSWAKCKEKDCDRLGHTTGLCYKHYRAKRKAKRDAKSNANSI